MAKNDLHALDITKHIISTLPSKKKFSFNNVEPPLFDANELHGIIGTNLKRSFDIKKIISRIVDGSKFHEFKAEYGQSLVTGMGEKCKNNFFRLCIP